MIGEICLWIPWKRKDTILLPYARELIGWRCPPHYSFLLGDVIKGDLPQSKKEVGGAKIYLLPLSLSTNLGFKFKV